MHRQDRRLAPKLDPARHCLDRHGRAVSPNVDRFEGVHAAFHDHRRSVRDQGRSFGRVDLGDRHSEQLFAGVAEALADHAVDFQEAAVGGVDRDPVSDAVEDRPELLFRSPRGLVELVPGGDVAHRRHDADDLAAGASLRPIGLNDPARPAGSGNRVLELARGRSVGRQSPDKVLADPRRHYLREGLVGALADDHGGRQPGQLLHHRIPDDDPEVAVVDDDALAGAGDDRLDEGGAFTDGGHVLDDDRELAGGGAVGPDQEVAVQGRVVAVELLRDAGQRDPAVALDPDGFEVRDHFQDPLADDVGGTQAGLRLECRVDFEESVVDRAPGRVADELVNGYAVEVFQEQLAVAVLGGGVRGHVAGAGSLVLGDGRHPGTPPACSGGVGLGFAAVAAHARHIPIGEATVILAPSPRRVYPSFA